MSKSTIHVLWLQLSVYILCSWPTSVYCNSDGCTNTCSWLLITHYDMLFAGHFFCSNSHLVRRILWIIQNLFNGSSARLLLLPAENIFELLIGQSIECLSTEGFSDHLIVLKTDACVIQTVWIWYLASTEPTRHSFNGNCGCFHLSAFWS